jgi:hypothetical protein
MMKVLMVCGGAWRGWRVVVAPDGERTLVRDPGSPETVVSKLETALRAEGVDDDEAREVARAAVQDVLRMQGAA